MNLNFRKIFMKVFVVGIFVGVPLVAGFLTSKYVATHHFSSTPAAKVVHVWPSDQLTISTSFGIDQLTPSGEKTLITAPNLLSPVASSGGIIAISRSQNYAAMAQFDAAGNLVKTLLDGDHQNFDKMIWVGDPELSPDQKSVVFVSDKDRYNTGLSDNAVYSLDLSSGNFTLLAKPTYLTGGLANPIFVPAQATTSAQANSPQLLVTSYQNDHTTFLPYSILQLVDLKTHATTDLTSENQNAFQPSFSADGKQLLFLSRDGEGAQVKLQLADFVENQLTNIRTLATGQFAYPKFSFTNGQIYYLAADKNSPFHLFTASISADSLELVNQQQVTTKEALPADSSYQVLQVR